MILNKIRTPLIYALTLLLAVSVLFMSQTQAADLLNRRITLGSSEASVNTQHTIEFDIATPAVLGSVVFEYCDNSPLEDIPCDPPNGFDVSGAVIEDQTGETGFSVHANTNANRLVISRIPLPSLAQPVSFEFSNIINPSDIGSHYLRVYTHANGDGTGAYTDRGGYAFAITNNLNVSAYVPPTLIFCMGVSIGTNDCSSVNGSQVSFGILTDNVTRSGTIQMAAATNAVGGYTLTLTGTTMTSGNNVINEINPRASSQTGTSQFGLNLRNNSSPNVGANMSGVGTGQPTSDYNNVNQYKFNEGDVIAFSPLSTEFNKYTASFITNVNNNQPAGFYSSTITIIALATF